MKQNKELTGEGKRLAELLAMQFNSQRQAAAFLNMAQPNLCQYLKQEKLRPMFWAKHAPKLAEAGLNAAYISDPENHAMMTEEAAAAYIAKIAAKVGLQKTA